MSTTENDDAEGTENWESDWERARDEYELDNYKYVRYRKFAAQVFANCEEYKLRNYSGRGGYEGPAVVMNDLTIGLVEIARATTGDVCKSLRWDNLGFDFIVYPG